eukprot:41598_1
MVKHEKKSTVFVFLILYIMVSPYITLSLSLCFGELPRIITILIVHVYMAHGTGFGNFLHKFENRNVQSQINLSVSPVMKPSTIAMSIDEILNTDIYTTHATNNTEYPLHSTGTKEPDPIRSYSVQIINESTSPILSVINHTTTYQQVYNPSWIPQSKHVSNAGLLVEVQNCSLKAGHCTSCSSTPALVSTACNPQTGACDPLMASSLSIPNISIQSRNIGYSYYPNPSIFYDNDLYYMFANTLASHVELYTSTNPTNTTVQWQLKNSAFPKKHITGPASLLPRNTDHAKHYLFFGGNGSISVSNSCLLTNWQNIDDSTWLSPRSNYFDKDGVETGPSPMKMNDGNYLMLYNAYNISHTQKEYSIGWVILNARNPTKIMQRSNEPLLTATLSYQTGHDPYTCTQRNSVYAKAVVRMNGSSNTTELFRVYFSAAGTSIGSAIIHVSHTSSNDTIENSWFGMAVIVSIGCAVFVVIMCTVICCTNEKPSALYLTTEPLLQSIASAAHACNDNYEDISGINHHGTPYVVGSLDGKTSVNANSRKHKQEHGLFDTSGRNPNHIHACSAKCYEHDTECGLNNSLGSNSSNSCTMSMSSSSCSCGISTSPSYCLHCVKKQDLSESIRLSQISFRINETLEKGSPSSEIRPFR